MSDKDLAKTYLQWNTSSTLKQHPEYDSLCNLWLKEISRSALWILDKDHLDARPVERFWNGLPTLLGTNDPSAAR